SASSSVMVKPVPGCRDGLPAVKDYERYQSGDCPEDDEDCNSKNAERGPAHSSMGGRREASGPGLPVRTGNVVTLELVDGGPGDVDGVANGVIVDPGGPGAGTITIPCDNGISGGGWTVFQTGGSGANIGTVTYDGSGFIVTEGNSFQVGLKHGFTIPTSPNILTFDYSNLSFDTASTGRIKDAFEAAFVDANGNSVVPTIAPGRNAFFNITDGL